MPKKPGTFKGGYRFKGFEGQPSDRVVVQPLPPKVIIPLAQGFGSALEPSVKVGDVVQAGQILARNDDNVSTPALASINGRITSIEKRNYFKREVAMVTIEGDGSDTYRKLPGHSKNWESLSTAQLEELLYTSGVTSLDRSGIPTAFKSSVILPHEVEDIIIHGIGSEVYNLSLNVLFGGKHIYNFAEGIKILKKIMPKARVHVVLNENATEILEKCAKLTRNIEDVYLHPVEPKYPIGFDEVLIPAILGKKFPYGFAAAHMGTIVLNIQAICRAYEAVAEGKPLIERTIALCGTAFRDNHHVKVRVGTPLEHLLEGKLKDINHRVVLNSLLAGVWLNDLSLPVDRTYSQLIAIPQGDKGESLSCIRPGFRSDSYSNSFLAPLFGLAKTVTTNLNGEERPCIQCGFCNEVCPVRILPAFLSRVVQVGVNEKLMRYGIFSCIDCNLCSYVCPCKVPLAKHLKTGKAKLLEMGCDHSLCLSPKFDMKGLEEYKGVKVTR